MALLEEIEKEKQLLARYAKSLELEKVQKRKADTRHKIELGGLVKKSGLDAYNKSIILGALFYIIKLIETDNSYLMLFDSHGKASFFE